MSIRSLVLSATILASLFSPVPATAAVIFDNGGPDHGTSFNSSSFQAADDFSLASGDTTITDVHWWGAYGGDNTTPPATDNFTIFIYDDSSGAPGSAVATLPVGNVTRAATGEQTGTLDLFEYSVDIAPTSLSPATTYWLFIFNGISSHSWFWATSGIGGNAKQRSSASSNWDIPTNAELAFNLTDEVTGDQVPEPSTLLLLGSGLAGFAAWRRRRK